MRRFIFLKLISLILTFVLFAAAALVFTGCEKNDDVIPGSDSTSSTDALEEKPESVTVLGVGALQFVFEVKDGGDIKTFEIHTDKGTVGEALSELGLIAGEDGPYGLYVKTVNGKTYSYDRDGKYWAFYINGEMAMSGVDSTDITEGAKYTFSAE